MLHRHIYPTELGGTEWFTDDDGDPVITTDENNAVDVVLCEKEFIFQGFDLIGMSLIEAIKIVGREPDEIVDDSDEVTAEFDDLGLQLELGDGVVVSVAVSAAIDDGEEDS